MRFKKDKPLIKVISTVSGLESIPEVLPRSSQKFLPSWWKEIPTIQGENTVDDTVIGNVKSCPSFLDYLSNGIIIPMWVDSIISFDEKTGSWKWRTSDDSFKWEIHYPHQFLESTSYSYLNKPAKFVFKAISPWKIITPKGYSVYQLPLFYHQQNDFSVLPGIIDTDYHHTINQQVMYHSDKTEIFIKKGTPFVQYITFKRNSFKFSVHDATLEEKNLFFKKDQRYSTSFTGSKTYLKLRREHNE